MPNMLTLADIDQELSKVSYRPGWTFSTYETQFEGPWILIVAPVTDAYSGETVDLGIRSALPPFRSSADLHSWLMWRLVRIESHEAREYYEIAGTKPFDPHQETD